MRIGKKIRSCALAIAVLVPVAGCGSGQSASSDTITIGVLGTQSTAIGALGRAHLGGVRAHFENVNESGGVNGKKIEVISLDDRQDLAAATDGYRQLKNKGVTAIINYGTSAISSAVAQANMSAKIPFFSPGLDPSILLNADAGPRFGGGLGFTDSARIQLEYVSQLAKKAKIDSPRIAIFDLATLGGKAYEAEVKKYADDVGWEVVETQNIPLGATDATPQAQAIAKKKPDYVLGMIFDGSAPVAVEALRNAGLDAPFVNYFAGSGEPTFSRLKDPQYFAVRGAELADTSESPAVAEMKKNAAKADVPEKNITESEFSTYGYVTAMLLEEGLKKCADDCGPAKLISALETIKDFESGDLSAPISISPDDHSVFVSGKVYRWDEKAAKAVPVTDWIPGH